MVRDLIDGKSPYAVASGLNARGVKSATGGTWTPQVVSQVARSPRLAGLRVFRGETVGDGDWPAIITPDDHRNVVAMIAVGAPRDAVAQHLLSNYLRCGRAGCGFTLHAGSRQKAEGGSRRYTCHPAPGRAACGGLTISAEPLEAFVEAAVVHALSGPALRRALKRRSSSRTTAKMVRDLETKVVQLGADHDAGLISRKEWLARRVPLVERLEGAREDIAPVPSAAPLEAFVDTDAATVWAELELADKRRVLGLLVESITVGPATKRGPGFDPDRVTITWKA
jgi:site-specific DNA recombinase